VQAARRLKTASNHLRFFYESILPMSKVIAYRQGLQVTISLPRWPAHGYQVVFASIIQMPYQAVAMSLRVIN
jgi:hypothetical protein